MVIAIAFIGYTVNIGVFGTDSRHAGPADGARFGEHRLLVLLPLEFHFALPRHGFGFSPRCAAFSSSPAAARPVLLRFRDALAAALALTLCCPAASRMGSAGFPMCVHVSEATRRRLGDVAEWIDFGAREIEGACHPEPVRSAASAG